MAAKLIFCNVPSNNPRNAVQFYSALLGVSANDFARAPTDQIEAYSYLISADGIDLKITARQNPNEGITSYFAVDDLNAALKQLQGIGATVVVQPRPVQIAPAGLPAYKAEAGKLGQPATGQMGQFALILDPDHNLVGLVQLSPEAQWYYQAGPHRKGLTQEQLTGQQVAKKLGQPFEKP